MRALYDMEVCEWYHEWWKYGTQVVKHQAWYSNRLTITSIRPSMRKGNFYRLYLSNGEEKVVSETFTITVERY